MKTQQTFTDMEFAGRKRVSRREEFLRKMDALIPWAALIEIIQPHYFTGKRGRKPRGIELMLRMYLLQNWYNLSDEFAEEEIYDSYAMKQFVRLDYLEEDVPDSTTLLDFRHLLEKHELQKKIFEKINEILEAEGQIMRGGSIIDATFIEAPSSTKNSAQSRDPEMHQAKKGNEWHHGMKAHIGVDAGTGMVHSLETTSANVSDIEEAHKLVREDDEFVNADAGYVGIEKREEIQNDEHLKKVDFRVNQRVGKARKQEKEIYKKPLEHLDYIKQPKWDKEIEYLKSKVRSKVEHNFYIIKHLFGYRKTRYRGLAKNTARLYMLFALANVLRWSWRQASIGTAVVAA